MLYIIVFVLLFIINNIICWIYLDASTEDFRAILEVNILGPTICTREAIKLMRIRKNEGHIININRCVNMPFNCY